MALDILYNFLREYRVCRDFRVENSIIFSSDLEALSDCCRTTRVLERIAEGLVSNRQVLWRCAGADEKEANSTKREICSSGRDYGPPPRRRLLIFVLLLSPFSRASLSISCVFLRGRPSWSSVKRGFAAFSSLSLNTPTPGEIQFYSADCFLLYRRLLR